MKDIKRAVYKIGKVRIPDYILGSISAFVLIIGFPYVVQRFLLKLSVTAGMSYLVAEATSLLQSEIREFS